MRSYFWVKVINFLIIHVITSSQIVFGVRVGVKYEHNRQELELTSIVVIEPNRCQNNVIQIFVHSAARTHGKYYERRRLTRDTWAKEAQHLNIRVTFVLGEPRDAITQKELLIESNRFKDILQFGFIDDYHNLTLKAIALLRWASTKCMVGHYVVKTDDDILVNTKRLKEKINSKAFHSGITGKMFYKSKPVRDVDHKYAKKWFVPKEIFANDYYPPYLSGAAYIMSTDIIPKLYNSSISHSGPILDIDDLYLTGIIAQKYRIQIYDSSEFVLSSSDDSQHCGIDVCKMYSLSTLHGCDSVNSTLELWKSWKNSTLDSCQSFFVKLHKNTTSGKVALIIAIVLLITFILSMAAMICQYYANYRDLEWQKVGTNVQLIIT